MYASLREQLLALQMPFIKSQQQKPAQWKTWEEDTFREGYRGAVFGSSNKEKYTGWYRKNVKHGKGFQTYDNDGSLTYYEGFVNLSRHQPYDLD